MQRIFVDYGRGMGDAVDLLLDSIANVGITVKVGERVTLYDDALEVEGMVQRETTPSGATIWTARPDWATRRDTLVDPLSSGDIAAPAQP